MSGLNDALEMRLKDAQMEARELSKKRTHAHLLAYNNDEDDENQERDYRDPQAKKARTLHKSDKKIEESQPGKSTLPTQTTSLDIRFDSNLIDDVSHISGHKEAHQFTATTRRTDMLRQFMRSVPKAERIEGDMTYKKLQALFPSFYSSRSLHSASKGGFILRGMTSVLMWHQLAGVSLMRDREKSQTEPHGGILADEMGFGSKSNPSQMLVRH